MKEQIILVLKETIPEMVDAVASQGMFVTLTESEKALVVSTVKGRASRIADYSAITETGKSVFFETRRGTTSYIADLYDIGNEVVQNMLRRAEGTLSLDEDVQKAELERLETLRKFAMSLYTEVADSYVAMALGRENKGGN